MKKKIMIVASIAFISAGAFFGVKLMTVNNSNNLMLANAEALAQCEGGYGGYDGYDNIIITTLSVYGSCNGRWYKDVSTNTTCVGVGSIVCNSSCITERFYL